MTAPRSFLVASYNIHKGIGTDRRRDLLRTAAVIADMKADIVALQEADTRFGTRTGLLDLKRLAHEAGLAPVPLVGTGAAHGWHGNLLLVRGGLVQEVHQIDLPGLEPRGAMITDLTMAGQPLRVVNAHLGLLGASRMAQARWLIARLATLDPRPTLLMGDLNEWRGDSGALKVLATQFTLAAPRPSFPSRYPMLALDRMMTCAKAALLDVATHATPLSRRASDHLPIIARLRIL